MKATLDFASERFEKFNREIFGGTLPVPEFNISSANSFMGQFKVVRKFSKRGSLTETHILTLSDRYDIPEASLEDILIHEMIHFHIHQKGLRDTSSHGRIFRTLMKDINSRHGRNISISHKCSKEQYESDTEKSHAIICLCTMTDGRRLVCRASKSKIFELHKAFSEWDKVEKEEWFWVYGSYFNRYRRVLTPRLFSIDDEGLTLIESAVRLEFAVESDGRMVLRRAAPTRR